LGVRPIGRLTLESRVRGVPGCVVKASISFLGVVGLRGRHLVRIGSQRVGTVMLIRYERCAGIDVGKDEIVIAVRLPGEGPDGRQTIRKTFTTFSGVLQRSAQWLTSLGVTHVAMASTGVYSMPVYHALVEHGEFERVLVCNPAQVKHIPGRKRRPG
jgi:transposase